jgi:hypothetical protein
MLYMLDGLLKWTAHSEHQEVWAGPSWYSFALKVRSLLLPGFQDPYKSVLLQMCQSCHSSNGWQRRSTAQAAAFQPQVPQPRQA